MFTALLITESLLASCTITPIPPHALEWQWPRNDPIIVQEYGIFNTYVGKYHTGLDIEGTGDGVFAAAQGTVVNFSQNRAGACPDYNATVDNHNMQGFVILQHTMTDGSKKYSLYVHLNQINENLKIGQAITRGTPLGNTGVFLRDCRQVTHVHFEIKDQPILENPSGEDACDYGGSEGPCWGYTPKTPDDYGYYNPRDFMPVLGTTASAPTIGAEEPLVATAWSKIIGGQLDDSGSSIQLTTDGGYIIAGSTESFRNETQASGPWLIKLDPWGNIVWDKIIGVTWDEVGDLVQQTSDGGYIIFGRMPSGDFNLSLVWLIKTDAEGNKVWEKIYGGNIIIGKTDQDCGGERYVTGHQTIDGGYIVIGSCFNRESGQTSLWLIKTDTTGNMVWDKAYEDIGDYAASWLQKTSDGGYIMVNTTGEWIYDDNGPVSQRGTIFLRKIDSMGILVWDKSLFAWDKIPIEEDMGIISYLAPQTFDGGYIVVGKRLSPSSGNYAIWLIKANSDGEKIWEKTYEIAESDCYGIKVQQTSDGGFIILGRLFKDIHGEFEDILLIKTDGEGNILWDRVFGQEGVNESGISIVQALDGGYAIVGSKHFSPDGYGGYDLWIIKTDAQGNVTNP